MTTEKLRKWYNRTSNREGQQQRSSHQWRRSECWRFYLISNRTLSMHLRTLFRGLFWSAWSVGTKAAATSTLVEFHAKKHPSLRRKDPSDEQSNQKQIYHFSCHSDKTLSIFLGECGLVLGWPSQHWVYAAWHRPPRPTSSRRRCWQTGSSDWWSTWCEWTGPAPQVSLTITISHWVTLSPTAAVSLYVSCCLSLSMCL